MDGKLLELNFHLHSNGLYGYNSFERENRVSVCAALGNSRWFLDWKSNTPIICLHRDDDGPNKYSIRFYVFGNDVSIIDDHIFSGCSHKELLISNNRNSYYGFGNYNGQYMNSSSEFIACQIYHCDVPQFKLLKSNPRVWNVSNKWKIPKQFFSKSRTQIKINILFPTDMKNKYLTVEYKNDQVFFKFEQQITEEIFIGGNISLSKNSQKSFITACKVGYKEFNVCKLSIPNQKQDIYFSYELLLFKEFTSDVFSSPSKEKSPTVSLLKPLSRDIATIYTTENSFSDVKVKVDQKVFDAHQVILCARSPVFKAMLDANMVEKNSKVIRISDLDAQSVEIMLKYIYSGEANIDLISTAKKLYYAGDKYQMGDLKEACSTLLKSNLNLQNVFQILIMADNHSDEDLKKAVQNFICMQKENTFDSEPWNQFMDEKPLLAAKTMQFYLKNQASK